MQARLPIIKYVQKNQVGRKRGSQRHQPVRLPLHERGRHLKSLLLEDRFSPAYLIALAGYSYEIEQPQPAAPKSDCFTRLEDRAFLSASVQSYIDHKITAHQLHMIHMVTLFAESSQRFGFNFQYDYNSEGVSSLPEELRKLFFGATLSSVLLPSPGFDPKLTNHNLASQSIDLRESDLSIKYPSTGLKLAVVEGVISSRDLLAYGLAGYSAVGLPTRSQFADFQQMEPLDFMGHDYLHSAIRFTKEPMLMRAAYEFAAILDYFLPEIDDPALLKKVNNYFDVVNDAGLLSINVITDLYFEVWSYLQTKDGQKNEGSKKKPTKAGLFADLYQHNVASFILRIPFRFDFSSWLGDELNQFNLNQYR